MFGMTDARIKAHPRAFDWAWLACDRDNHVAAFVTAGAGPIPIAILESDFPAEESEKLICSLPATTNARHFLSKGDATSFMSLAQRGIFVYDWQSVHRPTIASTHMYELVAAPDTSARLDSFPGDLAKIAQIVRFENVSFRDEMAVDVRTHTQCLA
jgi:hypothetical protein